MQPSIAEPSQRAYPRRVLTLGWKLLAAIALVLMPLSMATAGPAPAQAPHAMAAAGHCGDMGRQDGKASHCCDCAVTCSALLPSASAYEAHEPTAAVPAAVTVFNEFADQSPDTATPPPKFA